MTTSEILRFISVFASAIHTGSQFSLSFVSGAALLASPTSDEANLLTQFRVIFRRGFVLCPPFAAVATLANLGNALISWLSHHEDGGNTALRFLIAGLITASLVPFTLMFIVSSEGQLLEKAAERVGEGKEKNPASAAQTRDLIKLWARLNYMRTFFPLIGALISYTTR
ncbi:hypothetical protein CGRA01v4_02001 [Colletotrichum graminicola]|uniref:Integral membrane protein n=1 Tax=Colletotrichum graminicola (strain M1.001 / M2 / FGSC 10212) TaxID=645133 RepID=E3QS62_COLGM|nr:uncharacterized protein GLRG_08629 [Colletotrichum graminicola M1.001]EFQ33700.1 hypothetical protein GLRG_08629 [Colletotrichum graminicola M1.001]WDK10722.1 hypothetical protein CGRA01v4_02001 [Colletotrichum graminicola]